jgi:hypothetical protein
MVAPHQANTIKFRIPTFLVNLEYNVFMKNLWVLVGAAMLVSCAPAVSSGPKICPPELSTPIFSTSLTPDTEPDSFCFSDVIDAEPDTAKAVYSNIITVRGINQIVPIKASHGATIWVNDQFLEYFSESSTLKTVKAGDRVQVLVSASNVRGEQTITTISIGSVSSTFRVTTKR